MISTVIFDWGNVLCPDNNEYASKKLSDNYGIDQGYLYKRLSEDEVNYSSQLDCEPYFDTIFDSLSIPKNELKRLLNEVQIREGMKELVSELAGSYDLYLFSNQMQFRTDFIKKTYDLSCFKATFFSSEMGVMKPAKDAFRIVLNHISTRAEDCLFIDDNMLNIRTARDLGIHCILFTGEESLKQELLEMGILQKDPVTSSLCTRSGL